MVGAATTTFTGRAAGFSALFDFSHPAEHAVNNTHAHNERAADKLRSGIMR
jgi:hypothetical protein